MPPKDMLNQAKQAISHAYAPYSNFLVGACLKADDGQIFAGCNVENAAFPLTLCAEANALGQFICSGSKKIKEVLIIAKSAEFCPPCGACRQRLNEFSEDNTVFHLCTWDGKYQSLTMRELLPLPFNFAQGKK